MARRKLELNKDGISKLFMRHGEKILFVVGVALVALFVWLGLKTPSFDATAPDKLLASAKQAQSHIHDPESWDALKDYRHADTAAAQLIREDKSHLDDSVYEYSVWRGSLNKVRSRRVDPEFKAPKDLYVHFLRAQVPMAVDTPGERRLVATTNALPEAEYEDGTRMEMPEGMKAEMWVFRPGALDSEKVVARTIDVVAGTAVVPYQNQLREYENKFMYALGFDPVRDRPEYLYVEIQRQEEGGDWVDITANNANLIQEHLPAQSAPEICDERYIVAGISQSILPFLGIDYRQFARHPDVPYRSSASDKKPGDSQEEFVDDEAELADPFGTSPTSLPGTDRDPAEGGSTKDDKSVQYKLVRFFDVETGKQVGKRYRYRVRVWLRDPNDPGASVVSKQASNSGGPSLKIGGGGGDGAAALGPEGEEDRGGQSDAGTPQQQQTVQVQLTPGDLHPEVLARLSKQRDDLPKDSQGQVLLERAVPSPWSEPSDWIAVPRTYAQFIAGSVKGPSRNAASGDVAFYEDESHASLVALTAAPDIEAMVPVEKEVRGGTVMNFRSVANFLHPITWVIKSYFESEDDKKNKTGALFQTDALVVDVQGGEKLPFSRGDDQFYMPGEILVMGADGTFQVRNELEDMQSYRQAMFVTDLPPPEKKKEADDEERQFGPGRRDGGSGLKGG